MGLFSRKKKSESSEDELVDNTGVAEDSVVADEAAPETEAAADEQAMGVNISFSAFQGVGANSGPEVLSPEDELAERTKRAEDLAKAGPEAFTRPKAQPAPTPQPAPVRELPLAPAAPPARLETIKGLRDNAVLRDALASMPEKPTPAQLLGVARQLMQGHLFLRVAGDVREQVDENGKATLQYGVASAGEKNYMLVYSSGKALSEAVKADGNEKTSAVAQPVPLILAHMIERGFDGLIVDGASGQSRIVLPREVIERAHKQADPRMRVKSALAQPRDADTPKRIAKILAEQPPLWVAVGASPQGDESEAGDQKMGIAEARLVDGTRLLQVYSHPLEIVAQGRTERAMPFGADKIAKVLKDHEDVGGILIDPAGPLMTLTREELEPIMELADRASAAAEESEATDDE
jgi:hypothetical protein